ncbi:MULTISPECIES: DUF1307 domain-containing protein [unclassified Granulicatella]|uniref:DUF1307 domain-containing protein n=1 Tax=unclassified Granulicatella TaxID=2630493 RepID=UPI002553857B|nr:MULTISPECIES: DUF1307 domain-containing protein [unclassified Granulicatella]MDK8381558.1 DUF1307 domain-containing protein [Granulicatella sp. UMB5615B]MDK8523208.1 DUF1307 domain-containing protein [Granulicatella sp. UMB5615A]
MNTKIKQLTLLATAGFLLAACGQEKKEETTVATTTQETTAAPKTVYSLEDAQKAVFENVNVSGKDTVTLYYKDDVLLKQEAVSQFFVSKMEEKNPLDTLKKTAQKSQERLKDFIGKGFEIKTDYKNDIFTFAYSFDYTKLDLQKLKEFISDLNLRDDNTISYSEYKDSLAKEGYKEKQTTATKENAVQKVQAPEGQEVAVFKATIGAEVTEYIVYHKGDTITKVVIKAHRSFEKFGKSKDTLLKQEKIFTEEDVKERKEKYSSVDGISISYEVNGYTVTTIEEFDYTKIDFAKLKQIDPKSQLFTSFSEMKSDFENQAIFEQVQ